MKFRADHTFRGIDLPTFERLYFDDGFGQALCVAVKLVRALERFDEHDGRIHRAVRVGPDREIPPAAQAVLGGKRLDYTEHIDYVRGAYEGVWRTVPSLMPDKVQCAGAFRFVAVPGGVRRVVEGDIVVRLFGVGGIVEKVIVGDVERSYAQAAEFTQRWIDDGKAR